MQNVGDFETIFRWSMKHGFREKAGYKLTFLMDQVNRIVDTSQVEKFYPKGVLKDDPEDELFVFLKDGLLIAKYEEGENRQQKIAHLKNWKYEDLEVTLQIIDEGIRRSILTITHKNGTSEMLDSAQDSNRHWTEKYHDMILDIYKHLN